VDSSHEPNGFLGSHESSSKRHLERSSRFCVGYTTAKTPNALQWGARKLPLSLWNLDPILYGFLAARESAPPQIKVTIRPGYSGTVPIFNDVSQKKITVLPGRPFVPFLN